MAAARGDLHDPPLHFRKAAQRFMPRVMPVQINDAERRRAAAQPVRQRVWHHNEKAGVSTRRQLLQHLERLVGKVRVPLLFCLRDLSWKIQRALCRTRVRTTAPDRSQLDAACVVGPLEGVWCIKRNPGPRMASISPCQTRRSRRLPGSSSFVAFRMGLVFWTTLIRSGISSQASGAMFKQLDRDRVPYERFRTPRPPHAASAHTHECQRVTAPRRARR